MTVEIVHAQNNMVATLDATNDGLARLGQWVDAARNARQLVAPLVETPFVPDNYRPKVDPRATPEQKQEAYNVAVATATAAVLQGISLGIDPLTSLQQIYIVHGRPGMYAKMMVALIQSHGHEVWTEDLTDTRAVVAGRRRGSDTIERVTVTMEQARKAGWSARNENYQKTPQDMLWARAASRVCDRIASDVLKGLASVEAIRDELDTPSGTGTRTVRPRIQATAGAPIEPPLDAEPEQSARRAGRRAAVAEVQAEPEPELDEPVADVAPVTAAQQKKLHALLTEHGLGNREDGLARISQILGREVESTKMLSKADAMLVIDRLEEPTPSEEPPLDGDTWPATPETETDR